MSAAAAALDDFDENESSDDFVDSSVSAAKVDPKDAFAAERTIPKLVPKADWDDLEDSLSLGRCFAARVDAEAASFALAEKQRVLLKPQVRLTCSDLNPIGFPYCFSDLNPIGFSACFSDLNPIGFAACFSDLNPRYATKGTSGGRAMAASHGGCRSRHRRVRRQL